MPDVGEREAKHPPTPTCPCPAELAQRRWPVRLRGGGATHPSVSPARPRQRRWLLAHAGVARAIGPASPATQARQAHQDLWRGRGEGPENAERLQPAEVGVPDVRGIQNWRWEDPVAWPVQAAVCRSHGESRRGVRFVGHPHGQVLGRPGHLGQLHKGQLPREEQQGRRGEAVVSGPLSAPAAYSGLVCRPYRARAVHHVTAWANSSASFPPAQKAQQMAPAGPTRSVRAALLALVRWRGSLS